MGDHRYSLVRELACGGMGRIWIAEDARLRRRVAVKELLEPSAARALRFERELALTSRLEHPSIVSVHDGGTWPDGKPYYVMRLVSGESLEDVIDRTRDLRDRIALLPHGIAAVDAVAYAHAQGIVHRDLKPANVLVGTFGETVVIDWGVAKDLHAATPELVDGPYRDRAPGATQNNEVLGTPAYMPPEQATCDTVDERADVYALGAVLYHLLSGMAPYRGSGVSEVLARVIDGPPQPLARIAPGVPPDLVTIVDKAMAREPADRYPNAAALASDLKRFQSGQLVAAHRYTTADLVRRWLRRHRAEVIVAALAALALSVFAIVSITRIVREQREATAARALAERNHALADERRVAAEGLVTFMLGDLRDRLEPLGKISMIEAPARKVLAYFDARHDITPDERQARAIALKNLGDALRGREQIADAEAQYRAAMATRAQLVAEGHDRVEWHYLDATLRMDVGDLRWLAGASQDAIRELRTAIAQLTELTRQRPDDERGPRLHIRTLELLAGILVDVHDLVGAEKAHRDALAIAAPRARALPRDRDAQEDMIGPEHGIGDALAARGDHAGALAMYRATLARLATDNALVREDAWYTRSVALTQHRVGISLLASGDTAGALQALLAAKTMDERLVAIDPENRGWQLEHAINLCRLAQVQQTMNDRTAAIASYRQGIALLRSMSGAGAERNRLVAQLELGTLLGAKLGEPEFRDALAAAEKRVTHDAHNRQAKLDLGEAYARLGGALLELKNTAEALPIFTRALELARSLAAADPADTSGQTNLAQALVELAEARCHVGTPDGGFDEAQALIAEHLRAAPGDATWLELDDDTRTRARACKRNR